MSEISRLSGGGLPPPVTSTEAGGPVAAGRAPAVDVDTTLRPSAEAAASVLPPPAPPTIMLTAEGLSAAQTLAAQLVDLGAAHTSSDDLLAAFLKLQVLDATGEQSFENLLDAGRSALLRAAYDELRSSRITQAAALNVQAEQMEARSDRAAEQARSILDEAGVNEAEVHQLYAESVAAGNGGADIAERYRASRPPNYDQGRLQQELAAIEQAKPYAQEAAAAGSAAQGLAGQASAIGNSIALALYATETVSHGARSDKAQARIVDGQQRRARDLMSLLSGTRADHAALSDAAVDLDRSRNDVAKLLLDFIDRRTSATTSRLREFSAT